MDWIAYPVPGIGAYVVDANSFKDSVSLLVRDQGF